MKVFEYDDVMHHILQALRTLCEGRYRISVYRFGVFIRVDGRKLKVSNMLRLDAYVFANWGKKCPFSKNIKIHVDWALGLKIQSAMYNTRTAIVLLNNKTINFRDIKKHPSIQFSPLIDALLSLIKYEINMVRFRFTDCIVKINANWRKSGENDYVKKNLHAKEPLNRNHGDQNDLERGRPIIVADYKNGSNHQINAREIKRFAKRTFLC